MQKLKKGIRRIEAMVLALLLLVNTVDMSVFASKSQMISCENHGEHTTECGYVEGEDGSACNHECSVESGCLTAEVSENTATEETQDGANQEKNVVCDCETDDPSYHATNCQAYVAPEHAECFCAEKCTEDNLNVWCDVCGIQGVDFCEGEAEAETYETTVTYTAIDGTAGATSSESCSNLFDGKYETSNHTKWCVDKFSGSAYVIFKASVPVIVKGYSFVTGNDNATWNGRNPKSWTLYGCNNANASKDSEEWQVVHRVDNDTVLKDVDCTTFKFEVKDQTTKYQYFMLKVDSIQSGKVMQLCELIMDGTACAHTSNSEGVITKPTCTEQGYTTYICDLCGLSYKRDFTEPLGHDFGDDEFCKICGSDKSIIVGSFTLHDVEMNEYTYANGVLTIVKEGAQLTIANTDPNKTTTDKIIVSKDVSANITLAGVNIDVSDTTDACAFKIEDDSTGDVEITLADGTENILKSGKNCAGLQKNGAGDAIGILTIQGEDNGTGSLNATGGYDGAGIGGGLFGSASKINISDGIVTATGGDNGAGIGGGYDGIGARIVISGGIVTAIGGDDGAGIGGGYDGVGSKITISGGSVKVVEGRDDNKIGGGRYQAAVIPTDGKENQVYLMEIDNERGAAIRINDTPFNVTEHNGEKKVYVYLKAGTYTVQVGNNEPVTYDYIEELNQFVKASYNLEFSIEGGELNKDYVAYEDTLYILTETPLTIANKSNIETTTNKIVVSKDVSAKITLAGVNIDVTGTTDACAFKIEDGSTGDVTITLADDTENILKSGNKCAGLQKNGAGDAIGRLSIQGEENDTGSLVATGGQSGAGIGGGYEEAGVGITISGGIVIATGGDSGAGIGGGYNGAGSGITISDGKVTAAGGNNGAGIGGGYNGVGSEIAINGGKVTATGGLSGAGIGGGLMEEGSVIIINGGSVKAVAGSGGNNIGGGNGKEPVIPTDGKGNNVYLMEINNENCYAITINNNEYKVKEHNGESKVYAYLKAGTYTVQVGNNEPVTYVYIEALNKFVKASYSLEFSIEGGELNKDYVAYEDTLYILTETPLTIANKSNIETTTNKIVVSKDVTAKITLAGVNIDVTGTTDTTDACAFKIEDDSTGDVTITLADGTENILKSGKYCAGLQKNGAGDAIGILTIQGEDNGTGSLNATGGDRGAGIGSGYYGASAEINISGGIVTATGGVFGAGIGGGCDSAGSHITISGGTVTATGGDYGAGIGGGYNRAGSDITISGGTVIATGGYNGAGIGGIYDRVGSHITISGGTVTATGGSSGAGIGGGYNSVCSDITISGGSVKAVAGSEANKIGGGKLKEAVIPTDGKGNPVYLMEIDNENGDEIRINDTPFNVTEHNGEKKVYVYLKADTYAVQIGKNAPVNYDYIDALSRFIKASYSLNFSITGGELNKDYVDYEDTLYILTETHLTIANADLNTVTTNKIVVSKDVSANITLAGVNIDASGATGDCAFKIEDDSIGDVTITLANDTENFLNSGDECAGLQKNGAGNTIGTLTIQGEDNGTGSLTAMGGQDGAGIGGGNDEASSGIIISGGTVIATGGAYGAGIGGGNDEASSGIIISGGTVIATGGYAAGIGGGFFGEGSGITISGGIVTATGGYNGAGIGGGYNGEGSQITISGGTVTATGGESGAGIGGGYNKDGSEIIISGGSVKAVAGRNANKIGGGKQKEAVIPADGKGNNVYLMEINNTLEADIMINGKDYPKKHSPEDKTIYAYLPAKNGTDPNVVNVGSDTTKYCYNTTNSKWLEVVTIPEADDRTFECNGSEQTYALVESEYYKISDNLTQTDAGTYIITVTLNDPQNTIWNDDTTEEKKYTFTINHADANFDGICDVCELYVEAKAIAKENCEELGLDDSYIGYYVISNGGNLMWFAQQVQAGNTGYKAVLTADIDMSGMEWIPIGTIDQAYAGIFDGRGHVISNVKVMGDDDTENYGVFGTVSGTVKNLGVNSLTYNGKEKNGCAGGIAGALLTGGKIDNCYVIHSTIQSTEHVIGGIVGNNAGTISNSYSYDNTLNGAENRMGGICGDYADGRITNCYTNSNELGSAEEGFAGTTTDSEAGVADSRFMSGEIAYQLNGSMVQGVLAWGQKLKTEETGAEFDSLPVFKNDTNTVYYGYANCQTKEKFYSNTELYDEVPDHDWVYTQDETNKINFACDTAGCTKGGTVEIMVPTNATYHKDKQVATVQVNTEGDENLIKTPEITYSSMTEGVELVDGEPVYAGRYQASITLGEVTAYDEFEIAKAVPEIGTVSADTLENTLDVNEVVLSRTDNSVAGSLSLKEGTSLQYGTNDYTYLFHSQDSNYCDKEGTVSITITDTIAPTATYQIGTNGFKSFMNAITFGYFFKNTQTMKIEYTDDLVDNDGKILLNGSGVQTKQYYISSEIVEEDVIADIKWKEYTKPISLDMNGKYFVYAKVTDYAGNTTILNSDGIVIYEESVIITTSVEYTYKSNKNISFELNANGNTFKALKDSAGNDVNVANYIVTDNSKITFKAKYLDTLNVSQQPYTYKIYMNPQGVEGNNPEANEIELCYEISIVCKDVKQEVGETSTPEKPEPKEPAVGSEIVSEDGSSIYQVTSVGANGNTVTYMGPKNKNVKKIIIPATITIKNIIYKVTAISDKALANNKKITSVTIGSNVTSFSAKIFKGCTNLKTLNTGNGVTSIPANAFKNFKNLTTVTVGTKVKTIGKNAFYGCKKLKTVTLGKSVSKIGTKAFYGCSKLKTLTIKSTKLTTKKIGSKAFGKTPKSMTLKVPKKKFKSYKTMLIKRGVNKKAKFKKI